MVSYLSRSEMKRRAKNVEDLVHELAALAPQDITSLPCDTEVRNEIGFARNLKGGARKRQLKYVTKLLRERPLEELYDFLAKKKGSALKKQREFQELEHLRNMLLNEAIDIGAEILQQEGYSAEETEAGDLFADSPALNAITERFPDIDIQLLKDTAFQFAKTRNRKFSRELFRILRAASEKAQFT